LPPEQKAQADIVLYRRRIESKGKRVWNCGFMVEIPPMAEDAGGQTNHISDENNLILQAAVEIKPAK
jgi:hypothetical protein